MSGSNDPHTSQAWRALYEAISILLSRFGRLYDNGKGDYWIVDDDWGWYVQKVELQNLDLLRPDVIKALQALLADYPDWLITVQVDVPDKTGIWPRMGLLVYPDKITDDLQREYLPVEFRDMRFD